MSAASECYLNFIMVGIYLTKNYFNSKNYVFIDSISRSFTFVKKNAIVWKRTIYTY